jgi:diadenosine tetraphosphate (Ap4A) HIT family hydrolase
VQPQTTDPIVTDRSPARVTDLHELMQADFDRLMQRAQDVADELATLLGSDRGYVYIQISDVDPGLYHALPHLSQAHGTSQWKTVARDKGISHVYVLCAHGAECPDRAEAQP